jgi:hypothetical protein
MLLCLCLPGRRGTKTARNAKSLNRMKTNCYDGGGVMVIFDEDQLLPLYVVHFD